ncbi:hypothetical protein P3L10_020408 [Capsicum annuum]
MMRISNGFGELSNQLQVARLTYAEDGEFRSIVCKVYQNFNNYGRLVRIESWRALNDWEVAEIVSLLQIY